MCHSGLGFLKSVRVWETRKGGKTPTNSKDINALQTRNMSERKSARRAPTPKRFADEDVEKKPARKSTFLPDRGKSGGGSKVVRALVFTPFRILLRKPPLFFVVRRIRKFSLSLSQFLRTRVSSSSSVGRDLSRSRTRRECLSLFSLLFRWRCFR